MAVAVPPGKPRAVVAGYKVYDVLGNGPLGRVYRAQRVATGELVVFRGFHRPTEADAATWSEVIGKYAASLTEHQRVEAHPNIQKLIEWGSEGDFFWLASEFFEGRNLHRLLATDGPWTMAQAAPVFAQAAAALDHANRHGVVHGDITPYNVLVVDDGTVRVINFGLAHVRDRSDSPYRAPEQAAGDLGHYRSDVYGLTALLSMMLSGHPPFQATEPAELAQLIRTAEPALADVGAGAREALATGLAKSPALRFGTAHAMVAEVARDRRGPVDDSSEEPPLPWQSPGEQPALGLHQFGLQDQDFIAAQRRLAHERRLMWLEGVAGKLALAACLLWFAVHALAVPGASRFAEVKAVKGTVEARVIDLQGAQAKATPLQVGAVLDGAQQTTIHTGADSEAVLQLAGSSLKLGPATTLQIRGLGYRHGRRRLFALERGRVWAHVDKLRRRGSRFQIRSGAATITVHGTDFGVEQQPNQLNVTTITGQVQVTTDEGQQTVSTGQQVTAAGTGPLPAPTALTGEQLQAAVNDATTHLRASFLDRLSSWADDLGDASVVSLVDSTVGLLGKDPGTQLARSLSSVQAGTTARVAMGAIATSLRMEEEVPEHLTLDTLAELGMKPKDAHRILVCFRDQRLTSYEKLGPEQFEFSARAADSDGTMLRCVNGKVTVGDGAAAGGEAGQTGEGDDSK